MRRLAMLILLGACVISCRETFKFRNETRAGGYAMGEKVPLKFSLSWSGVYPDSVAVRVFERKTGFIYFLSAPRGACDEICKYECLWDGRKPDGSWPAGGRYEVYGLAQLEGKVQSDIVVIGLGD